MSKIRFPAGTLQFLCQPPMQFEAQDSTEKRKWIVLKGMIKNGKHHLPQPEESFKTVGILKAGTDLKKKIGGSGQTERVEISDGKRFLATGGDSYREMGVEEERKVIALNDRY